MASIQVAGFDITPAMLYRASATIFAVTIPGHIFMGWSRVFPSIQRLETASATYRTKANGQLGLRQDERVGLRGAQNSWNAWNAFAGVMALLAYQLALNPKAVRTREERAILVVSAAGNWLSSLGYITVGELPAALLLFLAPATALAGLVLEGGVESLTKWQF